MTRRAVEIVGAGPAGLSAAIAARLHGAAATVYEKRPDAGSRFHGDFQGLENWSSRTDVLAELEDIGIRADFSHTPVHEIVCFDPGAVANTIRAGEPIFYLLRRGTDPATLDQALKAQALDAGVTIEFGSRHNHVPQGGVVAEGPHRADVIAAGYVFETDMANGCYVAIADRLAPAGYSYLLVDQGRGTVATCLFDHFHDERRFVDETVAFFQREVGLRWKKAQRFGGSGNYHRVQNAVIGNRLYAGEAAGFQDALFGFGLRYALISGHLAGRSDGSPNGYEQAWRSRLSGLNAAGVLNRWLYAQLGDRGRQIVLKCAVAGGGPQSTLRSLSAPATPVAAPLCTGCVENYRGGMAAESAGAVGRATQRCLRLYLVSLPAEGARGPGRLRMNQPNAIVSTAAPMPPAVVAGAVLVMFLWALCFPLISIGLAASPPMVFATLRAVLAGAVLLLVAQWLGRPAIAGASIWGGVVLVGLTATGLGFFGMFYGGGRVSPGLATVIANTQPLIAAVLAWAFLSERLSRIQRLGLVAGFGGIVLIGAPSVSGSSSQLQGIAFILLGAVAIAISNIALKRLAGRVDSLRAMGWQLIIGSVPLGVLALTTENPAAISWTLPFLLNLVALSVIGTAAAFALWFSLLHRETLSRLNVFTFLTPIFGLVMGAVFFAEQVHVVEMAGIGLSLLGIYWVSRPARGRAHGHETADAEGYRGG